MLFDCPKCATRYDESEKTLGLHNFRVKCARCNLVFIARKIGPLKAKETPPEVDFEDETVADPGKVEFEDLTVSDGSAGPVRFEDLTEADASRVGFDDHTSIVPPKDLLEEPVTVLKQKPRFNDGTPTKPSTQPVAFDDTTEPDPKIRARDTKGELSTPPVQDLSELPDLSTGMGIFDDHTNPGVVKAKPAPAKPPDTIIPEMDEDLFSDKTRHATPSRELLAKVLPDLIDVEESEEKTKPE